MPGLASGQFRIEQHRPVRDNANPRRRRSRNRQVQRALSLGRQRNRRLRACRFQRRFRPLALAAGRRCRRPGQRRRPVTVVALPRIPAKEHESRDQQHDRDSHSDGYPFRRTRNPVLMPAWSGRLRRITPRRIVFRQQIFFVESQIPRNASYNSPAKNPAGQFFPVFILEGFQKALADPRCLHQFFGGHFSQLALALQPFAKRPFGHSLELFRYDSRCSRARPLRRASSFSAPRKPARRRGVWLEGPPLEDRPWFSGRRLNFPLRQYRRCPSPCQTFQSAFQSASQFQRSGDSSASPPPHLLLVSHAVSAPAIRSAGYTDHPGVSPAHLWPNGSLAKEMPRWRRNEEGPKMKVNNLDELFGIELRYAYDCEKKLVEKGLPTMMEGASSPELRSALEQHLNETRTHLTRLESIFPAIGAKTDTKSNDILWAAGRLLLVTNTPRLYHVFLA